MDTSRVYDLLPGGSTHTHHSVCFVAHSGYSAVISRLSVWLGLTLRSTSHGNGLTSFAAFW